MPFLANTRTAGEILRAIQRQFGDEASVQVSPDDVWRWINQGQFEIMSRNNIIRKKATTDTIADTFEYPLVNLNILSIQSIHVSGTPLTHLTFQDAETYIANEDPHRTTKAKPTHWYEWAGSIYLFPTPEKSITGAITIFYAPAPDTITGPTSVLSVPDTYYNALLKYCMAQAYELDENTEGQQLAGSAFESSVSTLSGSEVHESSNSYPMVTISPEDM